MSYLVAFSFTLLLEGLGWFLYLAGFFTVWGYIVNCSILFFAAIYKQLKYKLMKDISYFTQGQKKALLESLIKGKSNTTAETKLKYVLMDDLAEGDRYKQFGIITCMGYAKIINIDTFGEDYRERWAKIKYNGKGAYINNSYCGGRLYINE